MAMASIDNLAPTKSLIDLSRPDKGDFGLEDYELSFIFDDILLIEYVDETEDGDVLRNGIVVPTTAINKAWRRGKVILAGPDAKYAKEGDVVTIFDAKNNVSEIALNLGTIPYEILATLNRRIKRVYSD